MREMLDQWDFVAGAYVVALAALALMVAWSWLAMHRAERRRDALRDRNGRGL